MWRKALLCIVDAKIQTPQNKSATLRFKGSINNFKNDKKKEKSFDALGAFKRRREKSLRQLLCSVCHPERQQYRLWRQQLLLKLIKFLFQACENHKQVSNFHLNIEESHCCEDADPTITDTTQLGDNSVCGKNDVYTVYIC